MALEVLNFQCGRFFITREEFDFRVKTFSDDLNKTMKQNRIKQLTTFAALKSHKPGETNYVSGDIKIFVELLQYIVNKEFVDPSNMFKKVCNQYPFEFLLLCDFCREN